MFSLRPSTLAQPCRLEGFKEEERVEKGTLRLIDAPDTMWPLLRLERRQGPGTLWFEICRGSESLEKEALRTHDLNRSTKRKHIRPP